MRGPLELLQAFARTASSPRERWYARQYLRRDRQIWAEIAEQRRWIWELTNDEGSFRRFQDAFPALYEQELGEPSSPFPVSVKELAGAKMWLRPGTSDGKVFWETFMGRYHLPPKRLGAELDLIWDLGCNIGLTTAHLASRHPRARVIAVELDPAGAALARRNLEPWGERCVVLNGAVWHQDSSVGYSLGRGQEYGARIVENGDLAAAGLTLNSLIERYGAPVDYVKMDIEGAERSVLQHNTEWASLVRCIKVEAHLPYTLAECLDDLRHLGFKTQVDRRHFACAIGRR